MKKALYLCCAALLFVVWEEVPTGGVPTRQKVGRLRVNDVQNPTVARCKITRAMRKSQTRSGRDAC